MAAPETPKGRAALRFKQLAEQLTAGRVSVEVFAEGKLYNDYEELQALKLGAVQMLVTSVSKLASLGVPEFEVFALPFLFKDRAAFRAVVDGPLGAQLLDKLAAKGIKGLAYWDNGFVVLSANRSLHHVADFAGLRMRVQSSGVLMEQMKALRAVPVVTPLGEQYAELRDGRLDGAENVPSNFVTQRLGEVQKHLTVSNHSYLGYAVLVNHTFWDGLPDDVRAGLSAALREATLYEWQLAAAESERALRAIEANRSTETYRLTADEEREWRRVLGAVHRSVESRVGKETLRAVQTAAGYQSPR